MTSTQTPDDPQRRKLLEDFLCFIDTAPGIGRGSEFREMDYAVCERPAGTDQWRAASGAVWADLIARFMGDQS